MIKHIFPIILLVNIFHPAHCTEINNPAEVSISLASANQKNHTIDAVVQFKIQPGWHIYYKNPGDLGLPTIFSWKYSSNNIEVFWPSPIQNKEIIGNKEYISNIYENHIIFPIRLKLPQNIQDTDIEIKVDYATCNDRCIPQSTKLIIEKPISDITNLDVLKLIENST